MSIRNRRKPQTNRLKCPRQLIDEAMVRMIGGGGHQHGTGILARTLTGAENSTTRTLVDNAQYNPLQN